MAKEMIIDGSYFGGVLLAVEYMLTYNVKATEVELLSDEKECVYVLQSTLPGKEILRVFPC